MKVDRKSFYLTTVVILSFSLMLASLGTSGTRDMFSFVNADSMFFYAMYNDLVVEGGCLWGWDLNTTFNLMPNALLYIPALIIINHPVISQVIHGLLQYALFIWAAWYLLTTLIHDKALIAATITLPAWFFISSMYNGGYFLAAQFFHPYHFGAFIMTCFLIALNFRQLIRPNQKRSAGIIILIILATFSNRIFLLMFFLPWMISLAILWKTRMHSKKALIVNALQNSIAVITGLFFFQLIKWFDKLSFHPTHMFSWGNIIPSFQVMVSTYLEFFMNPFMAAIMLLSLGIYVMIIFKTLKRINLSLYTDYSINFHFLIFTIIFVPLLFFTPVALGMFFDSTEARYNFMVMVWLMLCSAPLIYETWENSAKKLPPTKSLFIWVVSLSLAAGVLVTRGHHPADGLRMLPQYYPERVQCVDRAARSYNLKHGISGFWDAKPVSAFSREGIEVRQVYHTLKPYFLGVNRNWYFPYCESTPQPVFNFILYSTDLDMDTINEVFGNQLQPIYLPQCTIFLVPEFTYSKTWQEGIIFNN